MNKERPEQVTISQDETVLELEKDQTGVSLTKDEVVKMIDEAKIEVLETAKGEAAKEIDKQVQLEKVSLITVFGVLQSQ